MQHQKYVSTTENDVHAKFCRKVIVILWLPIVTVLIIFYHYTSPQLRQKYRCCYYRHTFGWILSHFFFSTFEASICHEFLIWLLMPYHHFPIPYLSSLVFSTVRSRSRELWSFFHPPSSRPDPSWPRSDSKPGPRRISGLLVH